MVEPDGADDAPPASDALFRALADASAAITFIYQGERNVYANAAAERATGYTHAELRGMRFWDIIHPDSRELVKARGLARQRGEAVPPSYEVKVLTRAGEARWLDFTAAVVVVEGQPAVLGTAFDITDRVRAQQALAESEANYRRLFDNALVGVIQATVAGRITMVNQTTLELLGFDSLEDMAREPMRARYQDPAERDRLIARLRAEGRVHHLELGMLRKSGEPIRVEVSLGIEGDLMTGVFLDVTERRRLELEAIRAQRLESLGVVAGGLAHDFNNFLCAILSNVSMARFAARPGDESLAWLDAAEQACLRAKGLTQQLLTFARGGAPATRRVAVRGLLEEAVGFGLRGSSAACEWALPADLPLIEVDEGQITQVVHNLVLNAAQAMPGGGSLTIGAEVLPGGGWLRLSFEDTGPGISRAEQARIFDPYYTTKANGVGLGLATAHSIVKRHGGTLRLESKPPDGARFLVDLPVASVQDPPSDRARRDVPPGAGRVLVMDDEERIRVSTGAILRQLGYDVELSADGAEAVRLFEQARASGRPFDGVLLDLTVRGGVGGLDALGRLREVDPAVRAIVVSGYATDPALARHRDFGFVGRLQKPFTLAELASVVRDGLARRP